MLQTSSWELPLVARAYEGLRTPVPDASVTADAAAYRQAYAYCGYVVRVNSRTFHLAARLLPGDKRLAVQALYAFCRATDDVVDQMRPGEDGARLLEQWQKRLATSVHAYDPVPLAWADTQTRYRIPHGYVHQLIEGISRDLCQTRYQTFAELAEYCYGVASTVGLMVMHIVEFQDEAALPYAVKLGVALQLTNILRDVGIDWATGRLYLPLDELTAFDLTEVDIAHGTVDDRWRAFMRFQIARARTLYAEAQPGIALLAPEGRFAIAAAAGLYSAILERIEAQDYDVFSQRAHTGLWGKVRRIPSIWWQSHLSAE